MPETDKLSTTEHLIVYLEIIPESCDLSQEDTLKKLYTLYHNIYDSVVTLPKYTSHRSFSVKIFAHSIIFMDELEYPENNIDYFPRHSKDRSIALVLQFVADFQAQALIQYNILLKGYTTVGSLFRSQVREWFDDDNQHHTELTSELDFIWGEALVTASKKVESILSPYVIVDDNVDKYVRDNLPLQYTCLIHQEPITRQSIVNFGIYLTDKSSADNYYVQLTELIENCTNQKLRKMYCWTKNYLTGIPPLFQTTNNRSISSYSSPRFDQHYVLYIDLLGTKQKIDEDSDNHTEKWLNALHDIYSKALERTKRQSNLLSDQRQVLQIPAEGTIKARIFSDNIVIAYPLLEDSGLGLNHLIVFAGYFQAHALQKYRWMCYGYLTIGSVYLDNEFIYGPVFSQLIEIENSHPHLPKITVNPQILESSLLFDSSFITTDENHEKIVNYLETVVINENGNPPHNPIIPGNGFIQEMSVILPEYLNGNSEENIREKIRWSISFHNNFVDTHKEYMIYRIETK